MSTFNPLVTSTAMMRDSGLSERQYKRQRVEGVMRMKVTRDRGYWRVFELARGNQRVSYWGDCTFATWESAMSWACECVWLDDLAVRAS